MNSGWMPVSRSAKCPICGHDHYCTVNPSKGLCKCMRVSDGAKTLRQGKLGMEYFHELDGQAKSRISALPARKSTPRIQPSIAHALAVKWRDNAVGSLPRLAGQLGVSVDALDRLRVGIASKAELWQHNTKCQSEYAYTIPMSNFRGQVIGIALRCPDGFKFAVAGSSIGLYLPEGLTGGKTLLAVEGMSDCAAALTLGFDAVGRFSNQSCTFELVSFAREMKYRWLVYIRDNDTVGTPADKQTTEGAHRLYDSATRAGLRCLIIRPSKVKDLRQWIQAGGTGNQLKSIIRQRATGLDNQTFKGNM